MKIIKYNSIGQIIGIYFPYENVSGMIVDDFQAQKIMENPKGYKIENGELVETGYQVVVKPQIPRDEEIQKIKESIAEIGILMGGML